MHSPSTGHIFISYSRRDTEAMLRIVFFLRGQGLKAWVDNERLVPGTPIWEREIEKALDAAYAVVVVLSPDAKESVWVLNELTLADEFKKRVFPVLVRGDFRDSIPFRLVTRQFVDLRTNETSGLESLSAALERYLDELKRTEEGHVAFEQEAERQKHEADRLAEENRRAEEKAKEDADGFPRQKTGQARIAKAAPEKAGRSDLSLQMNWESTPRWNSVIWIALGWGICWAIVLYLQVAGISSLLTNILGGAADGFIVGQVLWAGNIISNKKSILWLSLGMAITGAIFELQGARIIVWGIIGMIDGLIVSMTLWLEQRLSNRTRIIWIALVWSLGYIITSSNPFYDYGIIGAAISGTLSGGVGGTALIWQLRNEKM